MTLAAVHKMSRIERDTLTRLDWALDELLRLRRENLHLREALEVAQGAIDKLTVAQAYLDGDLDDDDGAIPASLEAMASKDIVAFMGGMAERVKKLGIGIQALRGERDVARRQAEALCKIEEAMQRAPGTGSPGFAEEILEAAKTGHDEVLKHLGPPASDPASNGATGAGSGSRGRRGAAKTPARARPDKE